MPPSSTTTIGEHDVEDITATDTVIVHDDAMNIDRQVTKGERVPYDLVEAYKSAVGKSAKSASKKDDE